MISNHTQNKKSVAKNKPTNSLSLLPLSNFCYLNRRQIFKFRISILWKVVVALTGFLLGVLTPAVATAEISASVTGMTNYVWRGYSKSDDQPAIRFNIDYEHSLGFYVGTWVSTVDFVDEGFDDRANVEIAPYLGWTFSLSDDWRFDTQWTRYLYDGKIFGKISDYNEFQGFLHFREIGTVRIGFSENIYNRARPSADFEMTGRYPITDQLEFSAGLGYSLTRDVLEYDYLFWNAGFMWYYNYVGLDFRYAQAAEFNEKEDLGHSPSQFELDTLGATFLFSISFGF